MIKFKCQNPDCDDLGKEIIVGNLNQPVDLKCAKCGGARLMFNQDVRLTCGLCDEVLEIKGNDRRASTYKKPRKKEGMVIYCRSRNSGHLTTWNIVPVKTDKDYENGILKIEKEEIKIPGRRQA